MALIRPQQFYAAKLTRPLDLAGSETEVYVSTLPTETTGSLVINPRSSTRREKITYTGTSSSGGNHLTGVTRGVPFATATGVVTATSRVAANCLRHAVGESVEMVPGHYESLMSDILNGIGTMVNDINMGGFQFTNVGTPTLNGHVATKEYADNISTGGGPDANSTTKGFVEIATQTEADTGDDSGSTTAPVVMMPSTSANAVQRGVWTLFTETASGDDAYTATTTPSFTPANGSMVTGSFATANTAGATFALNGEAPVAIQKVVSGALGALETGDIIANVPLFLYRTASVWVLMSPSMQTPTTAIMDEMETFFGNTAITAAQATTLSAGVASDAEALHMHPQLKKHAFNISVPADTVENTVITATLATGRLGTKNGVIIRYGLANSGNGYSATMRFKYGSTTVASHTIADASTLTLLRKGECMIVNTTASAQDYVDSYVVNNTNNNVNPPMVVTSQGTATVDTSGAIVVSVTIQKSNGSMGISGWMTIEVIDGV